MVISVQCPLCSSSRVWKDGFRRTKKGSIQRFLCRECGYRFSIPQSSRREKVIRENNQSIIRQISVYEESKNLAEQKPQQEKASGATKLTDNHNKEKIFAYLWYLKKQGYAESTITTRKRILNRLFKLGADLFDPESVKEIIAEQKWKENTKGVAINTYDSFLKYNNLIWIPPIIRDVRTIPFIPTEREIDELIASCGKKTATFLQTLKETAARAGEAKNLEWKEIDTVRRTIRIKPEKNSNPRIFKVSQKLIEMLSSLNTTSNKVFGNASMSSMRTTFWASRKRTAEKLKNPRLLQIHFHTLRHWKATTLYHQAKDIIFVANFLGHKNLQNTRLYVQIEAALFLEETDEFTSKVAKTVEEAQKLVEAGFDFVCDFNGAKLFKKRK